MEDSSASLSAALGILCDLRREESVGRDITAQRARIRIGLQRHYHIVEAIIAACERQMDGESREELLEFLARMSEELAPHEAEIMKFVTGYTSQCTEIPGLTRFQQGMTRLRKYGWGFEDDGLRHGRNLIESSREQLAALIESLDCIEPGGSAGAGMRCGLPQPPGSLVAKDAKPIPPSTD